MMLAVCCFGVAVGLILGAVLRDVLERRGRHNEK